MNTSTYVSVHYRPDPSDGVKWLDKTDSAVLDIGNLSIHLESPEHAVALIGLIRQAAAAFPQAVTP